MFKRTSLILLSLVCLFLVACTSEEPKDDITKTQPENFPDITSAQLMEKAKEKILWDNTLYTTQENPMDDFTLQYYYGEEFASVVTDYAVFEQSGTSVNEIGIFRINTEFDEDAYRASSTLSGDALEREVKKARDEFLEGNLEKAKAFCENRRQQFLNMTENYSQEENAKAQNALITSDSCFVYYIISGDNAAIEGRITAQLAA